MKTNKRHNPRQRPNPRKFKGGENGYKYDFGRFKLIFLGLGCPWFAKFVAFMQYLFDFQSNRILVDRNTLVNQSIHQLINLPFHPPLSPPIHPFIHPFIQPTNQPFDLPTNQPFDLPTNQPFDPPTNQPMTNRPVAQWHHSHVFTRFFCATRKTGRPVLKAWAKCRGERMGRTTSANASSAYSGGRWPEQRWSSGSPPRTTGGWRCGTCSTMTETR